MDWLFLIFAVLTLVPALLVATSRNPVNAAMNMIISFVGMAALMVLLETYFLAVLQVLVYAGAIVVLFLFIIMLIDAEKAPNPGKLVTFASCIALLLMTCGVYALFFGPKAMEDPQRLPVTELPGGAMSQSVNFGVELFTRYMLPFQVAGFMLLIAMIGVIVISKKTGNTLAEEGTAQ